MFLFDFLNMYDKNIMELKQCNKCQTEKNIGLFSKNQIHCKECKKQYYQNDKERIKIKTKNRYENNKYLILDNQKQYYQENKENRIKYQKQYNLENKEIKQQNSKQYYQENKEKIKYRVKEWIKNKYKNNEEFRIQTKLNLQIIKYLRQSQNITKLPSILGYNVNDFIKKVGSPKNNEDIDHKVPISWFKKETPISVIWSLENLQIIESTINRKKNNHYSHPISENYKQLILKYIKEKYQYKIIIKIGYGTSYDFQ
jgi:Zn ribbon nucleic-acid-binding protein